MLDETVTALRLPNRDQSGPPARVAPPDLIIIGPMSPTSWLVDMAAADADLYDADACI